MTYPLRRGELLNFVTVMARDDWQVESWSEAARSRNVGATSPAGTKSVNGHRWIDVPYKWALLGRHPSSMVRGCVTLLGDPAIQRCPSSRKAPTWRSRTVWCWRDVWIPSTAPRHCAGNEAARLDRMSRIVRGSLENVSRYHNPQLADPATAQDFMTREFAPGAMGVRYDWLYEYDALSVPI